jgi:acyl-CoA synthetase (AMP-forming)/AMP-acid ligase II
VARRLAPDPSRATGPIDDDLDPTPLLDAVEAARGSMVDLDRGEVVTPDELRRTIEELERAFRLGGLGPGDRTVMAVGNGPFFLATLIAIIRAGGSPLLLHADTPASEVARTAERFGASFAVGDSLEPAELRAVGLEGRELSCRRWAGGVLARAERTATAEPGTPLLAGVPLHPTGGTTGEPKLAVRPGAAALAEARHYIDTIGIAEDDAVLCTIPMSHAYGFGMCVMVPLLSGATVRSMRRVTAGAVIGALAEGTVTVYPSMPATLQLLLATAEEAFSLPRCLTTAGTPLPERVAAQVTDRWGATVRPLYGTTETGGISVATPDRDPSEPRSVGPPMEGVSIRIEPLPDLETVEEGVGRLLIGSSSMMAGYLSPSGVDRSAVADGWFETGDLASLDEAGNIVLRGRASDVINSSGHKVLPGEVEAVIAQLPEVVEVKVYAAPNRWGTNSVKAAVVVRNGMTAADVRAHCKRHLVGYKQPEQVVLLEKLPRSPAGKILAAKLP